MGICRDVTRADILDAVYLGLCDAEDMDLSFDEMVETIADRCMVEIYGPKPPASVLRQRYGDLLELRGWNILDGGKA